MITDRRKFLAGLLATGLVPKPTWADAGSPEFLSAAALTDGTFVLCGIDANLNVTFTLPLPGRGHAAAAHPKRPEAVAFARRPGTFAVVIDCTTGVQKAVLHAPKGRHFYGHGIFSTDGATLFTTENDYEAGQGRIGVWDVTSNYARIAEWSSGGIGPHDIKRLPNSDVLVVANGGIETHPDTGRTKLNIPTMQPNLSYIRNGELLDIVELPTEMHKHSIRHLAVSQDGGVAFGMQQQGDSTAKALVGHHRLGARVALMQADLNQMRDMNGYVGSIAISRDSTSIVATSPRGDVAHFYDANTSEITETQYLPDVCGAATTAHGFLLTSGTGELLLKRGSAHISSRIDGLSWDNHLIAI